MLIQMKLALAERKRSVCTAATLFYWLLTFLQCNYHRDLRQLWQRVCGLCAPMGPLFTCLILPQLYIELRGASSGPEDGESQPSPLILFSQTAPKRCSVSNSVSLVSQPCTAGHSFSCYGNFFVRKWRQLHYSGESLLCTSTFCVCAKAPPPPDTHSGHAGIQHDS